ncbi:hypothetical protein LEP1GSC082_2222, partial [Leptospira kirschneri str. H2]
MFLFISSKISIFQGRLFICEMDKYYSEIPDGLWKQIAPLIPKKKVNPKGGR